ncbi:CDA_G0025630.mRNA.1.CDS.1 [Saccharomyces cerevisiae]|nr:Imp2'p [Saccharomyces cerevisiae YJM1400]AJR52517.1 Imp2'p [Saccharomyces cerevisiae YJM1479]CAI4387954.1 CDA_G0025630.mRNA.1.CDS.1 [Saccharomyces cerevisiae]CAI7233637.1 CDA_G0025630.mRNA.1.CDS.1 [Saccharomyces cerevisiae]
MQKSILLTKPDGTQSNLHSIKTETPTTVEFDSEQMERGHRERGRSKKKRGERDSNVSSLSRSRSRASSRSRVREEEFLKWTVLRQDPSMRLRVVDVDSEEEGEGNNEDDDDGDGDDMDEEESDEEQVSDIENDLEIDEEFHYDLGMKVLPNFCTSINEVLDSSKPWIAKYEISIRGHENEGVSLEQLDGGYVRAMQLLTKGAGAEAGNQRSFILYTDLSSESTYALTYLMGAAVNQGDTVYIVHWEPSKPTDDSQMFANVARIRKHVMHLFDCVAGVLDDLDVVVLSLTHPYPKHLLNEMIHGLKPVALCCSLSVILSTLQNFVCSVPILAVRKKLKRAKRKGISE